MRLLAAAAAVLALAAPAGASAASLRNLAFTPTDPLAVRQWYLTQDHAFDLWPTLPQLPPVKVAVIDSGIDGTHPEFEGRIVAQRSFVGGSALKDTEGHGTFVAGEIAAAVDNNQGIAGIAFPAQLLIGKVVRADGTISLQAEAQAIRWAANEGARVINLSLGGVRDPINARRDTFSAVEEAAVEYANAKGALVVAAVGNGDQAPSQPWPYASYPAALPHVLGVSALGKDGSVPSFSNRDAVYNDIAAPGQDIFSTLPLALTSSQVGCAEQGYSSCGPFQFRGAEGTSFAAPQVSAAAALVFATSPALRPEQVSFLLERTATDATSLNGCKLCATSRDRLTGWGHLDVAAAVKAAQDGPLPPADSYETNDDAGKSAWTLWGSSRTISATLDFWDDQIDVYRVHLNARQRLTVYSRGPVGAETSLVLWMPGTEHVESVSPRQLQLRARVSARPGSAEGMSFRATKGGWYYVELKVTAPANGTYSLHVSKS